MKIGIQTWGSHGDIRPFVALADGLQAAGHEVTLVITCVDSTRYDALGATTGFGLRIVSTPVVPDALRLRQMGEAIVRERNAIRQTGLAIEQFLLPAESAMFRASEELCAENDVVIGHYFLYPLGAAAEKHGRPYVSVVLAHGAVPSAFQPPAGVPDLGAVGNRLAWRLARSVRAVIGGTRSSGRQRGATPWTEVAPSATRSTPASGGIPAGATLGLMPG